MCDILKGLLSLLSCHRLCSIPMKPSKSVLNCQPKPAAGLVKVKSEPRVTNASPLVDDEDPYVLFSIQIRRSTYLGLKQAEYWMPGFGEMREHADKVLKKYVSTLPGSNQPLPEEVFAKIKKLNPKASK
jgi:hypothetical protein